MKNIKLTWLLAITLLAPPAFAAEQVKNKNAIFPDVEAIESSPEFLEAQKPVVKKTKVAKKVANKKSAKAKPVSPVLAQSPDAKPSDSIELLEIPKSAAAESGLTLEKAIAKALAESPRIKSSVSGILSAQGGLTQAGVYTNPSVGIDAEDVAGGGPYKGVDSAQVTFGVSQLIEIGGKRDARQNIASKEVELANQEYKTSALDLIKDVTAAYIEAVAAQENLELAKEQRELAGDVLKNVSHRVNEAAAPLIQRSRADVEYASSAITLDSAQNRSTVALKNLSALIGEKVVIPRVESESFYNITKPAKLDLQEQLKQNPDLTKLDLSLERSKALVELEEANAVPDPSINLGVRDYRADKTQALVLGFSIPLPIFNANEGNISKARHEANRLEFDNKQVATNYNAKLANAQTELNSDYIKVKTLKEQITPAAKEAFKLAKEGYNLGRFSYLDVLDSQRTLFGVREQYIEALKDYHLQNAEIERLTAANLNKIELVENGHE